MHHPGACADEAVGGLEGRAAGAAAPGWFERLRRGAAVLLLAILTFSIVADLSDGYVARGVRQGSTDGIVSWQVSSERLEALITVRALPDCDRHDRAVAVDFVHTPVSLEAGAEAREARAKLVERCTAIDPPALYPPRVAEVVTPQWQLLRVHTAAASPHSDFNPGPALRPPRAS